MRPSPVILLTGPPRVGKTTIVRSIVSCAAELCGGFYTVGLPEEGPRTHFEIVTVDGDRALLASKFGTGGPRVGAYRVNVEAVESIAVPAISNAAAARRIVVIDEIGPMEIFSTLFRSAARELVENSDIVIFGTVVERSVDFADEIKVHPRVRVVDVTLDNRDSMVAQSLELLQIQS